MKAPFSRITLFTNEAFPDWEKAVDSLLGCLARENRRRLTEYRIDDHILKVGDVLLTCQPGIPDDFTERAVQAAEVEIDEVPNQNKIPQIASGAIALSSFLQSAPVNFLFCRREFTVRLTDKPVEVEAKLRVAVGEELHRDDGALNFSAFRNAKRLIA